MSEALMETLEPDAHVVALMASRLAALKGAKYITTDGDVLTKYQWEKEQADLDGQLRPYIEKHGPIEVEGLPPLVLQPRSKKWYRLPLMLREHPEMVDFLMEQGLLDVRADARKLAETSPQLAQLKKYAVEGAATSALMFEKGRQA